MQQPDIANVSFQILPSPSARGEQVRMNLSGQGPFARAIPLRVRVGNQLARVGAFRLTDGSVDAFLLTEPAPGEVVFVGWEDDDELLATPFTYTRPVVA